MDDCSVFVGKGSPALNRHPNGPPGRRASRRTACRVRARGDGAQARLRGRDRYDRASRVDPERQRGVHSGASPAHRPREGRWERSKSAAHDPCPPPAGEGMRRPLDLDAHVAALVKGHLHRHQSDPLSIASGLDRRRSPGARGSSLISRAKLWAAARNTAWRSVTRRVARVVWPLPPPPRGRRLAARPRREQLHRLERQVRAAAPLAALGRDDHVDERARAASAVSSSPPVTATSIGALAGRERPTRARRGPSSPGAGQGPCGHVATRGDGRRERGADRLLGRGQRVRRREAGRHLADGERPGGLLRARSAGPGGGRRRRRRPAPAGPPEPRCPARAARPGTTRDPRPRPRAPAGPRRGAGVPERVTARAEARPPPPRARRPARARACRRTPRRRCAAIRRPRPRSGPREGRRSGGSSPRSPFTTSSLTLRPTRVASIRIGPSPCSTAFDRRLPSAWARRPRSALTRTGPARQSTCTRRPACRAAGCHAAAAERTRRSKRERLAARARRRHPSRAAARSSSAARERSSSLPSDRPRRRPSGSRRSRSSPSPNAVTAPAQLMLRVAGRVEPAQGRPARRSQQQAARAERVRPAPSRRSRRCSRRLRQPVADPAHVHHEAVPAAGQLAAQPAGVRVDGAGGAGGRGSPTRRAGARPSGARARVGGERVQQAELLRGQLDRVAVEPDRPRGGVDRELARRAPARAAAGRSCAAARSARARAARGTRTACRRSRRPRASGRGSGRPRRSGRSARRPASRGRSGTRRRRPRGRGRAPPARGRRTAPGRAAPRRAGAPPARAAPRPRPRPRPRGSRPPPAGRTGTHASARRPPPRGRIHEGSSCLGKEPDNRCSPPTSWPILPPNRTIRFGGTLREC